MATFYTTFEEALAALREIDAAKHTPPSYIGRDWDGRYAVIRASAVERWILGPNSWDPSKRREIIPYKEASDATR
jgi:hypothetical protein